MENPFLSNIDNFTNVDSIKISSVDNKSFIPTNSATDKLSGILDIMLRTITVNLDAQKKSGRIRQEDYANAYVTLCQTAIQTIMQYFLERDKILAEIAFTQKQTEILDKKTDKELELIDAQIKKINKEVESIDKEIEVIDAKLPKELEMLTAQINKLTKETNLIDKQIELIDVQVEKEAEQIETYKRQRKAYDEDYMIKALSGIIDPYIAFLTSMPNVDTQVYPSMFVSNTNAPDDTPANEPNGKLRFIDGLMNRIYTRVNEYASAQTTLSK